MDTAFGILGRTALRVDGIVDEGWGAPQLRAFLGALLIHPNRRVSVATLKEWIWPDEETAPRHPMATLQSYATRIRRCLPNAEAHSVLAADDGAYRLEVDRAEIDLYRFRDRMADVRAVLQDGRSRDAVVLAVQAIDLWRGRPLDDLSGPRAETRRIRLLHDEYLPANTLQLEVQLTLNEYGEVLGRLNDLQEEYPHAISLAELRMTALHGLSRTAESDAYYFEFRRWLLDNGDEPAADHLRRHQENLRNRAGKPDPLSLPEPAAPPRQLPHDVDHFVGRAGLLQELDLRTTTKTAEESTGCVVVLDGIPGVGKTALAVHWAHLAQHRFPDGQLFINLNGFSDDAPVPPSTVVDEFLSALGHPPDRSVDPRSRRLALSRLLTGRRRMLVVLDNARGTEQVKDLIPLLTSCVVIVTSRQRLTNLSIGTATRRVRVEPMPDAEAAALLTAPLKDRHIGPEDQDHLVRLCGGLPVAITILADQIAALGVQQIPGFARHLDRRALLQDIGDHGDGSATVHTVFSLSYQRLAPPERRLFRLLGLHPGSEIGIDVARACDGRTPMETKQSFGTLVGAHLLERPVILDRSRFHDLLREYAASCAERDEPAEQRSAAERRMLTFYLHSAEHANRMLYPHRLTLDGLPAEPGVEPLGFTSAAQAASWFDRERFNLIAAIQFAAGHYHDYAWRLADTVVIYFDRHGFYQDSRTVLELAVAAARAAGHREGEMSSLEGLSKVCMILGDHAEAQRCLETSLRHAQADGNERAQATTLYHLGRLQMQRGNPAGAVDLYERCLEIARQIGDEAGLAWSHCQIGAALRTLQRHGDALFNLHQAKWFAERIGDQSAQASTFAVFGAVHRDQGELHSAMAYAQQALLIAEAIPDLEITVQAWVTLAEIASERTQPDAVDYARQAVQVCRDTQNVSAEAHAGDVLGDVHLAAGEAAEAVTAWQLAADLFDRIGNPGRAAQIQAKIGKVLP
ncbi:MAG TPA: tetratricopeptide repeat protein [Actinophytocola sp.]|uniref:ATP-binding protein n=1 Tax=Actinophytocola sp. TaxID=1872138 RepID=UPI002DB6AC77|nr:tetratricopeptide repeat protein [Actinophytocola sp.]HEU5470460.1 tetratricopeptide repeat protein [Actinophytocola sp.]